MDVEKFVRHLCRLVLLHQMPVWNYFVNSFYSVIAHKSQLHECRNWERGRAVFHFWKYMFRIFSTVWCMNKLITQRKYSDIEKLDQSSLPRD